MFYLGWLIIRQYALQELGKKVGLRAELAGGGASRKRVLPARTARQAS